MKNYISINGMKTELTEDQIEQIKASFGLEAVKLSTVPVGDTKKIGEHEMIVLEQTGETTVLICRDFIDTCAFGSSNNYNGSKADSLCNKFAEEIAAAIGKENLVEHTVDLTSDDGLKDYGTIRRHASLLTTDLYRRYVYTLDKHSPDAWWWLATAFSTPTHGYESAVKCVSPSGSIYNDYYFFDILGVRPFCILKSNIFVSK